MSPASSDPACWEATGGICRFVYDATDGNETLARLADWLVAAPLQIVLILAIAAVLARLSRRWVSRWVRSVIAPDREATARRLKRLGVTPPNVLAADIRDPRRDTRAQVISTVVGGSLSVLIWTVAIISALGRAGFDLGPLIAGAGIAGVALGFGAQSLVKDWIAGLFILLEDQYGVGDVVDLGEATGSVERFSLRATVLRGVDGIVWHVPNGEVVRVGNRSQLWSVALLDVDVAYSTEIETASTLLHQTAAAVCESSEFADTVLEPPAVLGVERLGADGVTLRLMVKTTPGAQWALQRALRASVKQAFDQHGVEIPFPQRTVWMRVDGAVAEAAE
jgi:moderate conductance mechanosensitive channel